MSNPKFRTSTSIPTVVHPVAYISGIDSLKAKVDSLQLQRNVLAFLGQSRRWSFYLQNADILVCSDHRPLVNIFTANTDNEKCNTQGLEVATMPRCIKVQHIKGIDRHFI